MKHPLILVLLLLSLQSGAQNYSFLNSGSKKLFISIAPPYHTYSIAFDSVKNTGSDTAYYNFLLSRTLPAQIPSNCGFWGTGCTMMRDLPSWIGHPLEYVSTGAVRFYNANGDSLNFDLNLNIGDTSVFYNGSSQVFKFVFETTDTVTVFGNLDTANFYRILHTDTSGNVISSALNQQQVIVAKENGLIQFFRVDSFPQVLMPVTIAGNNFPEGGLTAVTSELIYDYQPGDIIQTRYYIHSPSGPPWANATNYDKATILSRTDLTDSILYQVYHLSFNIDSATVNSDTVEMKYYRYDTIATIPFEFYDEKGRQRLLALKDYCGQYLWTYQIYNPNGIYYCPAENCYGGIDVFADPYTYFTKYVAGLGLFEEDINPIILSSSATWSNNKIVYFKKNGISCGQEVFVGINETTVDADNILLYPSPTEKLLHINLKNSGIVKNHFQISNVFGAINAEGVITGNETTLDVSQLENGIYFLRIFSVDNTVLHKKFIKAD